MSAHHGRLGWRALARFRRRVLDARGWRCERCGNGPPLELHHVRPLERGGAPFDPENVEVLCRGCHIQHHSRLTPEERAFLNELR